jgi:hypothetical protein
MCVPLRYFIRWRARVRARARFQSSLSGACTLFVRNAIAVQVSGLAHLVAYNLLATRLWKFTAFSGGSFLQSSSTLERSSGAALDFVPPPLGSA